MKNILVPIDGSEGSKNAIQKAKEFAMAFNSNVTLLHIRELPIHEGYINQLPDYMETIKEMSQNILNEGKSFFSDLEININIVALEGYPVQSINKYIDENDIDLIIMGSEGLGAGKMKKLLLGSVTDKVLRSAEIPVLVVR